MHYIGKYGVNDNNITEEYKLRVKGGLKKSDKTVKVALKDSKGYNTIFNVSLTTLVKAEEP